MRVTGWQRSVVLSLDRAIAAFTHHWIAAFNLFFAAYVGLPFLAPVLMVAGLPRAAQGIYIVYAPLCHQLGYRSWFLFGEKPFYEAPEFQARTGIEPYSIEGRWQAKNFLGDAKMGYKVAFCERDVAIYGGILLAGLIFGVLGPRVPKLHWLAFAIVGVVPIALDGFSQLLSQPPVNLIPPFSWLPFRESTPFLRTLTGGLFGVMCAWLAYPYFEESMQVTRLEAEEKLKRVEKTEATAIPLS
ncbi:MAG: DUF2085 domain-containing protein [Chloroflexi bacterium]|nr:DUF2085 domain-containing protein [Chloroflexota bacterium]